MALLSNLGNAWTAKELCQWKYVSRGDTERKAKALLIVSLQAAPVTGTEDLTYANLKFEKKGTGSASSNVIYTEIKPLQQKQSGGDGSAACTEVDVSPKEEGK